MYSFFPKSFSMFTDIFKNEKTVTNNNDKNTIVLKL